MTSPRSTLIRPAGVTVAVALAAGLVGIPTAAAQADAPARGTAILIGGGIVPGDATSEDIIQEIVDLAAEHAGGDTPRIAIVTAGSEPAPNAAEAADGDEYDNATANGLYYGDWFRAHGAEVYAVPIDQNLDPDYPGDPYTAQNAFDSGVADEIRDADAVYFGGGDQSRYVRSLMQCTAPDAAAADVLAFDACTDTPALAAMRELVDGGGVAAGSSAGLAIQQGAGMITGGEPYQSWRDGATAGVYDDERLGYVPAGGFGFFEEGLIDSHFARRDRQPRIVRLALDLGRDRAYGVEENTALVVDRAARTGRVIGELGVSAFDLSDTTFDGLNAAGINSSYLTAGSTIDFATGETVLAGDPTTQPGTATAPEPAADIWGSYECEGDIFGTLNLAQALVASSASRAHGDTCVTPLEAPTLRVTMNRVDTTAWNSAGGFTGLRMSITGSPAMTASAAARGAGAGGTLPAGTSATIEVTVKNTGAVPLGSVALDGQPDAAVAPGADASAPLAPGASRTFAVTRSVAAGTQDFSFAVTAQPVTEQGAGLEMDSVTAQASTRVVGTGAQDPGDQGEDGDGDGDKNAAAPSGNGGAASGMKTLASTGSEPIVPGIGLAGLAAAAGVTLLAGAALRGRKTLGRPAN